MGLAAAYHAAKNGHAVEVLEAAAELGTRTDEGSRACALLRRLEQFLFAKAANILPLQNG
jgi:flavin-dependent dehydrogenase